MMPSVARFAVLHPRPASRAGRLSVANEPENDVASKRLKDSPYTNVSPLAVTLSVPPSASAPLTAARSVESERSASEISNDEVPPSVSEIVPTVIVVLPLPALLNVAVSPTPGTGVALQFVVVLQRPLVVPFQVALAANAELEMLMNAVARMREGAAAMRECMKVCFLFLEGAGLGVEVER